MNDIACRPEMQCLHAFGAREILILAIGLTGILIAGYIAAKTWRT